MSGAEPTILVTEWEPAEVYEDQLREVLLLIDQLKQVETAHSYVSLASIEVWSKNDFHIGTLAYSDEQWRFLPHHDAWEQTRG